MKICALILSLFKTKRKPLKAPSKNVTIQRPPKQKNIINYLFFIKP